MIKKILSWRLDPGNGVHMFFLGLVLGLFIMFMIAW